MTGRAGPGTGAQLAPPTIGSCADTVQSEASRRRLLGSLADTGTRLLGTPFPPPTADLVITRGDAYRLSPVPSARCDVTGQ
ncbi:hypothetical protein [Streptomyces sp. NPDC001530]|uniref:hypothetical protein n=1 Tax=Streptomyces sp. NPDC001530 TaxID=3364582 RepID=UPI00369A3AF6